ncbi:MAG: hypothetical protein F6K24_25010 [Okeania sp. SIO2D1]|nr:hypothetical protein [Okeania sp. SIO2D1]
MMRVNNFLTYLTNKLEFNARQTAYFMDDRSFQGGWEVWLQCNIGFAFYTDGGNWVLIREAPYIQPNVGARIDYLSYNRNNDPQVAVVNNAQDAARADFKMYRVRGLADTTYVELKCKRSNEGQMAVAQRFNDDIQKTLALTQAGQGQIATFALLCTYTDFGQEFTNSMKSINLNFGKTLVIYQLQKGWSQVEPLSQRAQLPNPVTAIMGYAILA